MKFKASEAQIEKVNASINDALAKENSLLFIKKREYEIAKQLLKIRGISDNVLKIKII